MRASTRYIALLLALVSLTVAGRLGVGGWGAPGDAVGISGDCRSASADAIDAPNRPAQRHSGDDCHHCVAGCFAGSEAVASPGLPSAPITHHLAFLSAPSDAPRARTVFQENAARGPPARRA